MANFTVQGDVKSRTNGQPVQGAKVEIFQVDNPSPGVYTTTPLAQAFTGDVPGVAPDYFRVSFPFTSPPKPNVVFRVSQQVSGALDYLYTENPATDTRRAIADVLNVHLKVDDAITANPPDPSQLGPPPGTYFVFTRVGNIMVGFISQTTGYAYYNDKPPGPPYTYTTCDSDAPFGGTLWIGGWFGMGLIQKYKAKYYRIEYSPGVKPADDPGPWTPITDALTNYWYDQTNHNWVVEAMGPVPPSEVGGVENLYKLPHDQGTIPWAFPDLLMTLDTTKIPNGLYTLRVVGYDGTPQIIGDKKHTESKWASTYVDAVYGTLKLQLDNSPPVCRILPDGIKYTASGKAAVKVGACDIITLSSGDRLDVQFEASDSNGHLRLYSLNAIYGHDQVVAPPPTTPNKAQDDYSAHINGTHHWSGLTADAAYVACTPPAVCTPPPAVYTPPPTSPPTYDSSHMPSCAYNFRLRVDKRTNNGYGLVYWGYEDNYLITIQRA